MKTYCKLTLLALLPFQVWAGDCSPDSLNGRKTPAQERATVEKRKTIIKIYDVSNRDNLLIDNQFGQVNVNLWDKSEIRVQITISANSSRSEERTQQYLESIEIVEARTGDQISLKTVIDKGNSVWSNQNGENNYIRINYDVSMPKTNALTVRNKFGDTSIPMFQAPLTVTAKHGNFSATDLTGRQNDIDVSFGNADIRNLDQGKLAMAYSNLDLARVNVLELKNQFGKLNIGDVGRLNAAISYSGASKIGTLRESGKIKLSFSGGFHIDQMPKSAEDIDINASYSSVAMPMIDDGDFDVTVSYGSFHHNASTIRFSLQPSDDPNRGPRMTKQYTGQVGRGTGTKVRIISKFGDVNFR